MPVYAHFDGVSMSRFESKPANLTRKQKELLMIAKSSRRNQTGLIICPSCEGILDRMGKPYRFALPPFA